MQRSQYVEDDSPVVPVKPPSGLSTEVVYGGGLCRPTVDVSTHRRFGVEPTTLAQFACRYADILRGDAQYTVTPA